LFEIITWHACTYPVTFAEPQDQTSLKAAQKDLLPSNVVRTFKAIMHIGRFSILQNIKSFADRRFYRQGNVERQAILVEFSVFHACKKTNYRCISNK